MTTAATESPPDKTNGTNGAEPAAKIQEVLLTEILRSPFNREVDTKSEQFAELVASIKLHGVIQPGVARPLPSALDMERKPGTPRVELVIGEHRWLGSEKAGRKTMPLIVRQLTDVQAIELQAIENDKRKDLNPLEEAVKYKQLIEAYLKEPGLTKEKAIARLCEKLHKGKSTVYEALRLLKLPAAAKTAVQSGKLPPSHAGLIAKLENRPDLAKEVTTRVLSPRRHDEAEDGVLGFRATKDLVLAYEDRASKESEYNRIRDEFAASKLLILTPAENKKLFPYNNSYLESDQFVKGSDMCRDDRDYRSYEKLWGKNAPLAVLAQLPCNGQAVVIYARKDVDAAIAAAGKIKKQRAASASDGGTRRAAASIRAAAATRKKLNERNLRVERLLAGVESSEGVAKGKDGELRFLKLIGRQLAARSTYEISKKIVLRRGGEKKGGGFQIKLGKLLEGVKNVPAARALLLDMCVAPGWGGDDKDVNLAEAEQLFPLPKEGKLLEHGLAKVTLQELRDSYSADRIDQGKIRTPVTIAGKRYISGGGISGGLTGTETFDLIELIPKSEFKGVPTTYAKRFCGADEGEAARRDPRGGYYGIEVEWHGEKFVLGKEFRHTMPDPDNLPKKKKVQASGIKGEDGGSKAENAKAKGKKKTAGQLTSAKRKKLSEAMKARCAARRRAAAK